MKAFILYNLEVFFCLAIFYGFYYISLRRETNHRFVRAYLLGAVGLSFVLPLFSFGQLGETVNEVVPVINLSEFTVGDRQTGEAGQTLASLFSWFYAYLAIMAIFLVLFGRELLKIRKLRKANLQKTDRFQGFEVVIHKTKYPTFSFLNTIYLAKEDLSPDASRERILLHEASHVKGAHSLDILFMEILRIVFWVNPMIYLFKNALILSHEYIADSDSVAGDDQQKYVNLLVNQTLSNLGLSLGSHFGRKSGILPQWPWANGLSLNKSQTLKRIKMIKNKSKMNQLKYLIPVVAILLSAIVVSCVQDESVNEISEQTSDVEDQITKKLERTDVFQIVDEAPAFIDGEGALYKYLGTNITYPKQARNLGIEGRVFVQFVVNKDGSISDAQVIKGIGAGCDAEALRVVSNMPDWNPGSKEGEDVNVKMVLPIYFKLPDSGDKIEKDQDELTENAKEELVVVGHQSK